MSQEIATELNQDTKVLDNNEIQKTQQPILLKLDQKQSGAEDFSLRPTEAEISSRKESLQPIQQIVVKPQDMNTNSKVPQGTSRVLTPVEANKPLVTLELDDEQISVEQVVASNS